MYYAVFSIQVASETKIQFVIFPFVRYRTQCDYVSPAKITCQNVFGTSMKYETHTRMPVHTTELWMFFTATDMDILNCRALCLSKDIVLDKMLSFAENDDSNHTWYKIIHYQADGVFYPGDIAHVVIKFNEENASIDVCGIYDQYEMIPDQIRDNDLDYWIEDIGVGW